MDRLKRIWRHLVTGTRAVSRTFPSTTLAAIDEAVRACEAKHPGEIRFAVEDSLPALAVWYGVTPRERAIEKFGELRVWDTEHNNGVLIYVLLADRDVEIVADRGVASGRVPPAEWEACCRIMEEHFRAGRFREGAIAGIKAVAEVLARHPPTGPDVGDELPNRPALL